MAINYNSNSFYRNTPIVNRALDIWRPINVQTSINDTVYEIPNRYDRRPDLAANDLFGNPNLWYVFALRNKDLLIDPIFDFRAGLEIFVPSVENI